MHILHFFDTLAYIVFFIVWEKHPNNLSLLLRDFRHEKTKKKRGTYRGGQIDLQSHSIKFNYSDDEWPSVTSSFFFFFYF